MSTAESGSCPFILERLNAPERKRDENRRRAAVQRGILRSSRIALGGRSRHARTHQLDSQPAAVNHRRMQNRLLLVNFSERSRRTVVDAEIALLGLSVRNTISVFWWVL